MVCCLKVNKPKKDTLIQNHPKVGTRRLVTESPIEKKNVDAFDYYNQSISSEYTHKQMLKGEK